MAEIILRPTDTAMVAKRTAINHISGLDPAKSWRITVVRYVKGRSLPQNALLHKWIGIIADDIGDDADSVKYDLKRMFSPPVERTSKITGEITMEPKPTSAMTTLEMTEFMDKVLAFAASQLGIILPVPEDLHEVRR